jgi:hypothetical protein
MFIIPLLPIGGVNMQICGYFNYTNTFREAIKDSGDTYAGYYMPVVKPDVNTRKCSIPPYRKPRKTDVILTSAPAEYVFDLLRVVEETEAEFILWDMGERRLYLGTPDINLATAPFQSRDWNILVIHGLSSHHLGTNLVEARTFLCMSKDSRDILPPKQAQKFPNLAISSIFQTRDDPDFVPVSKGTNHIYHKCISAPNQVNKVVDDFHVKAQFKLNPLRQPLGYVVEGKFHRMNPFEVSQLVSAPPTVTEELIKKFKPNEAMYLLLREPSRLLWADLIERFCHERRRYESDSEQLPE